MSENELLGTSLSRLFNLQRLQITMLEHSIIRDDLYTKEDILCIIQELYVIDSVIKVKSLNKKKNAKTKQ